MIPIEFIGLLLSLFIFTMSNDDFLIFLGVLLFVFSIFALIGGV